MAGARGNWQSNFNYDLLINRPTEYPGHGNGCFFYATDTDALYYCRRPAVSGTAPNWIQVAAGAAIINHIPRTAFTPQLKFGGANVGMTTNIAVGWFEVIGGQCLGAMRVALTAKGSSVGAATFDLPTVSATLTTNIVPQRDIEWSLATTWSDIHGAVGSGAITMALRGALVPAASNVVALADTDFGATSSIAVNFSYPVP